MRRTQLQADRNHTRLASIVALTVNPQAHTPAGCRSCAEYSGQICVQSTATCQALDMYIPLQHSWYNLQKLNASKLGMRTSHLLGICYFNMSPWQMQVSPRCATAPTLRNHPYNLIISRCRPNSQTNSLHISIAALCIQPSLTKDPIIDACYAAHPNNNALHACSCNLLLLFQSHTVMIHPNQVTTLIC